MAPPMFGISHSQHHVSQLQAFASDWVFIVVIQEFSDPLQPPLSLSTGRRLGRPKLEQSLTGEGRCCCCYHPSIRVHPRLAATLPDCPTA